MPLTGQPRYPSQVPRRGRAMRNLSFFFQNVCSSASTPSRTLGPRDVEEVEHGSI